MEKKQVIEKRTEETENSGRGETLGRKEKEIKEGEGREK
jgi:hypothetical protein